MTYRIPPPPHKRLTLLAAALVALVLALPVATYAQQCPGGLFQKDPYYLTVDVGANRGSTYNPDTHQFTTDTAKYSAKVTVNEKGKQFLTGTKNYTSGQFWFGMKSDNADHLHHGVRWSAGRLHNGHFSGVGTPIHFHNLEPGTKYAVELLVANSNIQAESDILSDLHDLFRFCFQTPDRES